MEEGKRAESALSFEAAIQELETLVSLLEKGQLSLEESIKAYERGTELKAYCERILKEATLKVEKVIELAEEGIKTEPFLSEAN